MPFTTIYCETRGRHSGGVDIYCDRCFDRTERNKRLAKATIVIIVYRWASAFRARERSKLQKFDEPMLFRAAAKLQNNWRGYYGQSDLFRRRMADYNVAIISSRSKTVWQNFRVKRHVIITMTENARACPKNLIRRIRGRAAANRINFQKPCSLPENTYGRGSATPWYHAMFTGVSGTWATAG